LLWGAEAAGTSRTEHDPDDVAAHQAEIWETYFLGSASNSRLHAGEQK